jgi:hypothetical protein
VYSARNPCDIRRGATTLGLPAVHVAAEVEVAVSSVVGLGLAT